MAVFIYKGGGVFTPWLWLQPIVLASNAQWCLYDTHFCKWSSCFISNTHANVL